MANKNNFSKISINPGHLPTLLLILGYPLYWVELYLFKSAGGRTTFLAWGLFIIAAVLLIKTQTKNIFAVICSIRDEMKQWSRFKKSIIVIGITLSLLIIFCAFYASLLPPHLPQEYDALNYHISIPRQHLILGTFKHLPWSSADLFLLPIDFSLASFWLATALPNKMPQFFFLLGLIYVSARLSMRFSHSLTGVFIVVFAVIGSHGFGIQMGTAMLDVVICYLALAALDSLLGRNYRLAAVEFAFFFWAKPFMPLQMTGVLIILFSSYFMLKKLSFHKAYLGFAEDSEVSKLIQEQHLAAKLIFPFMLISIIIAGPFVAKSLFYSGTPLFPFQPGMIKIGQWMHNKTSWAAIVESSKGFMGTRNAYGYGRSILDFVKHFWLVAVPGSGVNNKFDYPLGLPYLLFLGPFSYLFYKSLRQKEFAFTPVFVMAYWVLWWLGSHQSRFLYLPLALIFLSVASYKKMHSGVLLWCLVLALALNCLSVFRTHENDFFLPMNEVLRPQDQKVIALNKNYRNEKRTDILRWDSEDVAFAQFPVFVVEKNDPFVLFCRKD